MFLGPWPAVAAACAFPAVPHDPVGVHDPDGLEGLLDPGGVSQSQESGHVVVCLNATAGVVVVAVRVASASASATALFLLFVWGEARRGVVVLLSLGEELDNTGEAGVAAATGLGLVERCAAAAVAGGEIRTLPDKEFDNLKRMTVT